MKKMHMNSYFSCQPWSSVQGDMKLLRSFQHWLDPALTKISIDFFVSKCEEENFPGVSQKFYFKIQNLRHPSILQNNLIPILKLFFFLCDLI